MDDLRVWTMVYILTLLGTEYNEIKRNPVAHEGVIEALETVPKILENRLEEL